MERDLFGNRIAQKKNPLEKALHDYDKQTFLSRFDRLKYVDKILPDGYFMTNLEIHDLLLEAKATFINGQFAATILLAQAVIEQWLYGQLSAKYNLSKRTGLNDILNCLRANDILHPYLIKKIDKLRKIRNPFVHKRPYHDPDRLEHRALSAFKAPEEIIEKDAKEALELMYQVVMKFG